MEELIIKKEDKLRYTPGVFAKVIGSLTLTASTLSFADRKKTFFAIPVKDIVSVNTKKGIAGGSDHLVVFYKEGGKEKKVRVEHYYFTLGIALGGLMQIGTSYFTSWEQAINDVRFGKGQVAGASGADELEKLAALKDRGVITDEEFAAKKKQILGL